MNCKFTIQQMLWATLAFGFVAMAITAAYRGNIVAFGVLIAPLFMTITFAVLALVYWLGYFVCRLLNLPIHTPTPADFSTPAQLLPATQHTADSRYTSPMADNAATADNAAKADTPSGEPE